MNELQKDISGQALQIQTISKIRLTKGQSALLNAIRQCVQTNKSISWDIIVDCYYNNVSKIRKDYRYIGDWNNRQREYFTYDIYDQYKDQNSNWQYVLKPRIRQWFVSSIGILVIKNQLIIIPTIEMD